MVQIELQMGRVNSRGWEINLEPIARSEWDMMTYVGATSYSPTSWVSDSLSLIWSPIISIFNNFQGMWMLVFQGPHFEQRCVRVMVERMVKKQNKQTIKKKQNTNLFGCQVEKIWGDKQSKMIWGWIPGWRDFWTNHKIWEVLAT